jgi:hypothetical protein
MWWSCPCETSGNDIGMDPKHKENRKGRVGQEKKDRRAGYPPIEFCDTLYQTAIN